MYTGNPSTNPIDALRLEFGDTDEYVCWLTDEDYQYYIDNNTSNSALIRKVGNAILMRLARETRERSGQEEKYGSEAFKNYKEALLLKLKDPAFGMLAPISYFGGINREDMESNAINDELVQQPFYEGQIDGRADWQTYRVYRADHNIEPEDNNAGYFTLS